MLSTKAYGGCKSKKICYNSNVYHHNYSGEFMKKLFGFTLAEVLITLGIIGVVAALTIPNLIQNQKKKTVETRLAKFYSVANQAIKMAENDYGPKEYWDFTSALGGRLSTTEYWNKYFNNYIKTVKVIQSNNLGSGRAGTIAYFSDGSLMIMKDGYDIIFYPDAKNFDINKSIVDNDDGSVDRPDRGTKSFAFTFFPNPTSTNYTGKGIEPYRSLACTTITNSEGKQEKVCNDLSRDDLLNNTTYGCNDSSLKTYCTALIQENGWKIPDDYPFRF